MPFVPRNPFSGGSTVGGRVTRPTQISGGGTGGQTNQKVNPRAAAPAKPAAFVTSGKVIATENMALGTGLQQGQTFPLPTLGDITSLTLTLTKTAATGSATVTVDYANIIDHIIVRNRNGTPFDTIPIRDPNSAGLNPAVYDLDTLFIYPVPTTFRTNPLAASTAVPSSLCTLTIPGLRCSAVDGPWQVETWYAPLTNFSPTGITALTVNNRIRAGFGDAGGYNSKFAYQTIPTTGTGDYHLETSGIVKNTLINQLLLENMTATHLAYLDHMVVNSHGSNIDTNLAEAEIVQGMTDNFYNAFGTQTLVPTAGPPAINGQFTIGDSDELIANFGTSVSNLQVVYQYLLPAGDAY
jgi:hypothetical protein